jgi:hypothetical protein
MLCRIVCAAEPGALARIADHFSRMGSVPDRVFMTRDGAVAAVQIDVNDLTPAQMEIVALRLRGCPIVETVELV